LARLPTRRIRSGFYALRLHEAGLIQSSPRQLIAEHTDWRFALSRIELQATTATRSSSLSISAINRWTA